MSDLPSDPGLPRRATWFELFFDLVFVVAVAGLAGGLARHYDLRGAAEFAFLFLVLWWLWLGQAFLASRFDRDRPADWLPGFAQMLAVVFIAHGAGEAFGSGAVAFAGGIAVFKALLMLGYLAKAGRPGMGRLCRIYGAIYGVQAGLWGLSVWAGPGLQPVFWALALGLDLVSPFLVASETHRAPPHPEHLPERFGLFTIILLGETAAAAVHALDHGPLTAGSVAVALMGAVLGFLYWVGYFHRAGGGAERHIRDAAGGRRLRLWAYGHIPLYLGIASLGAGTVVLAHHPDLHGAEGWIFSVGAAAAMIGVTVVSVATHGGPLRAAWPHAALALVAALLPAGLHRAPELLAGLVAISVAQVLLAGWRGRAGQ